MDTTTVFHRLSSLSDATRARLLNVLERHELAVSELVGVVQLPQSTVSRHLRILADEGWVTSRAEGTSRYYRRAAELEPEAARLWEVVRESASGGVEWSQDEERAREALSRRRTRSQEYFASAAGQWDTVRAELFGERPELLALPALLDPEWVVGDLGCGTGRLAGAVAPYVRRVIAVDESPDMLNAARARLAGDPEGSSVELRRGRLESLPVEDGELDVAVLSLVLHYVADPARALAEAARVVRRGGRVLVVDMETHGREEYRERMGHVWLGFEEEQVAGWLRDAGLEAVRQRQLPPDPEARGPLLFVAVATKSRGLGGGSRIGSGDESGDRSKRRGG